MPIDKYYKGHGREVMADMKARYGDKQGEAAFYANKKKGGGMKGRMADLKRSGKFKKKAAAGY